MTIGNWTPDSGVFVIAEIGGNHGGRFDDALAMIGAAARTGVDAVKFQRYDAARLVQKDVPTMAHVQGVHRTQRERMASLEFTDAQWAALAAAAAGEGVLFLASAFDEASLDAIAPLVPAFKIASGDLTHHPLVAHAALKGKPVILSTGMADDDEIAASASLVPQERLLLMHCVSRYPTPPEEANLGAIPRLASRFGVPVGYSDHTIGSTACLAAVALGAVAIEKHFTLDKSQPIGDHKLSAEPDEMADMVARIREISRMTRPPAAARTAAELQMRSPMRRGLYASRDLPAGHVVAPGDVIALRPERGLRPERLGALVGRTLTRHVAAETPFDESDL
jgi:sialic acid synthase SpsE